jgi:NTE family protein
MPAPVPLQFAFQGGGAKIVALLAVAEVIQEFEHSKKIVVKRVAGTSAGAVVAALIAAGIRADVVMAELRGGAGRALIQEFDIPSKPEALFKLFRNKAIWNTAPLRDWLKKTFEDAKVVKVSDASKRVPLTITKTDLGSRGCVPAQEIEMIADALIDSCALPYLFRIWNPEKTATFVDGGISNNLPANYLSGPDTEHGELVVLSFAEAVTDRPDDFESFSLALLDSAISSHMGAVKEAHRNNLMEISTKIGTFDFAEALSDNFKAIYDNIKEWARKELQAKIDRIAEASLIAEKDPWSETNPTAVALLQSVGKAYTESLATSLLRYDSCRLVVYSNAGRPQNDPYRSTPDRAEFRFIFHSGEVPTYCIAAGFVQQSKETTFFSDSANCLVTAPDGKPVAFVKVPARIDAKGTRDLCLFFTPPLPPNSGPYTVRYDENGKNLMPDLFTTNKDEIGYFPQRPDGPVGRIELVLFVHKSVRVQLLPQDLARPGFKVAWQDVIDGTPLFPDVVGHCMAATKVDALWALDVIRLP